MNEDDIPLLEETFYVAEHGFSFVVETGLNLTNMIEGDLKAMIKRADGSIAIKNIPLANITDVALGIVMFQVDGEADFSVPGRYIAQVLVRDEALGIARPSHPFAFNVCKPIGGKTTFPWI